MILWLRFIIWILSLVKWFSGIDLLVWVLPAVNRSYVEWIFRDRFTASGGKWFSYLTVRNWLTRLSTSGGKSNLRRMNFRDRFTASGVNFRDRFTASGVNFRDRFTASGIGLPLPVSTSGIGLPLRRSVYHFRDRFTTSGGKWSSYWISTCIVLVGRTWYCCTRSMRIQFRYMRGYVNEKYPVVVYF